MGLLDDAIREHLELKRRRGADPAEVEKQEREALGPIGAGAVAAPAVAEPETAASEAPYDEEPVFTRDPEPEPEYAPEPAYEPEPEPEPEPAYEPEPEPVPPPPAAEAPAAPPPVSQPTQQYSVSDLEDLETDAPAPPEDVVPADEDPEAEDVLDETPDFLEETPEHDRLWFEQRPPRDFDF
jgi:hypothetical protein